MSAPNEKQMMRCWNEYFDEDNEDEQEDGAETADYTIFEKVDEFKNGITSEEVTMVVRNTQTNKFYAGDLYFISWDQQGEEFESIREVEPYETTVTKYRKVKS